jgi:hypothetical protein
LFISPQFPYLFQKQLVDLEYLLNFTNSGNGEEFFETRRKYEVHCFEQLTYFSDIPVLTMTHGGP